MTGLFVKLSARHGKRDDILHVLRRMMEQVQHEPGTIVYTVHTVGDRDVWIYELYEDEAALERHARSATMEAVDQQLAELRDGTPLVVRASADMLKIPAAAPRT